MKSRLLVAAFGIPLVVVMLILPPIAVTILAAAISVMAVYELFCAVNKDKNAQAKSGMGTIILCSLSALGHMAAAYLKADILFYAVISFLFLIILFGLWVAYHERGKVFGFVHMGAALMAGLIIPLCLSSLIMLRAGDNGVYKIFVPIGTAFIGDAGALFAGMAMGKHKLAPKTSPKKTVEGMLGGVVSAALFMIIYGIIMRYFFDIAVNLPAMALIGAVCGILAQLGDLTFSLIKREFGIKDYGSFLPGHGGALDRFDSMITVAPAVAILFILTNPF